MGVPRTSLLLRFFYHHTPADLRPAAHVVKQRAIGRSERRLGHPLPSERELVGSHSDLVAQSECGARPESQLIELKIREMPV